MQIEKKFLRKVVRVSWVDSTCEKGWAHPEEALVLGEIHTFGLVANINKTAIEIASTIGHDGEVLNRLSIPIGCVIAIKEIK